jgi:hypothetical protein
MKLFVNYLFSLYFFSHLVVYSAKFYIYEWADEFDDVWPSPGAELHMKSGYNHVIHLICNFSFQSIIQSYPIGILR